jgi:hypothetical protein
MRTKKKGGESQEKLFLVDRAQKKENTVTFSFRN